MYICWTDECLNESNIKSHTVFRTSWSGDNRTQPLGGLCLGNQLWPSWPHSSLSPGSLVKEATNFLLSQGSPACTWTPPWEPSQQSLPRVKLQCHLLVTRKPAGQAGRKGKEESKVHYGWIWSWNLICWTPHWSFCHLCELRVDVGAPFLYVLLTKDTQSCLSGQSPFFKPR